MAENTINVQKHAMHFGTCMGVFWIVKFALFPLGLTHPLLLFLFMGLTFAVPFIGYRYACKFRDKICEGAISFVQAWLFLVFMYLFAALLMAAARYIYFRYIDNGYIIDFYTKMLTDGVLGGADNYVALLKETLDTLRSMTPIEITMQLMSQNVFWCSLAALITAPFVAKKKKEEV